MRNVHPKRKQCPVGGNAHPLARQLFRQMKAQKASITDVAERAGICLATLVKWKYRHSPTVQTLEAAGNVLGWKLVWSPIEGNRTGRPVSREMVT